MQIGQTQYAVVIGKITMDIIEDHMIDNQIIGLQRPGCRRKRTQFLQYGRRITIKMNRCAASDSAGQSGNVDIFPVTSRSSVSPIEPSRATEPYRTKYPVRQIDGSLIEAVVSTDILIQVAGIGTAGQAE